MLRIIAMVFFAGMALSQAPDFEALAAQSFARVDRDPANGVISTHELDAVFDSMDSDGNGEVLREQFTQGDGLASLGFFNYFDSNHDGVILKSEMDSIRLRMCGAEGSPLTRAKFVRFYAAALAAISGVGA
ncbi:hypothetical protein ScPMuIL_011315 [Solemya velum]